MYSAVSLCAGGGLAAGGMRDAGLELAGAVEYDPSIAGVYSANFNTPVNITPLQDVDFTQYRGIDMGQVSPPCPSFSVAKRGQETDTDRAIADAIVRFVEQVRPRWFWLENVEGYAKSQSYRTIRAALDRLDYWSHCEVVNAADYGVPQTRRRLILRAVSGGWMQPFRPLPPVVPWRGWYEAIEDLIPDLPLTQFADWQIPLLPDYAGAPLLVEGKGNRISTPNEQGDLTIRAPGDPAPTVRTDARFKAWLETGRVVKMTPRALARFQSVPDSYHLPESRALASRVIGNGVPWLLAQRVTESLLY
jgi:DNA (cytosine-5)-methyltransferase 1